MSKLSASQKFSPASSACTGEPQGFTITFNELTYSMRPKTGGPPVSILKGVSGCIKPSRVLAIMGSSGAGKTTVRRWEEGA